MQTDFIVVAKYCDESDIETSFVELLAEEGLIELRLEDGVQYFPTSQLSDLERYVRWHYDLAVNIAGIDVIRHLLARMESMQREIYLLKKKKAADDAADE